MATVQEAKAVHRESFIRRYIFSLDHKVIGIQYLLTSMFLTLLGGLLAMGIRLQLGWPGHSWPVIGGLNPASYLSIMTIHGTIMILFALPTALTGGFANFLIPLQIGARDMAFPFLNMLSYWLVPPAIILLLASFFVPGGAPMSGWTAYPPLSALPQAAPGSGLGQTLWLLSIAVLIVAFLFGSLNYITTILQMRTRGLSMLRLPMTIWAMLITAVVSLLSFPVLLAAVVLLLFDRHGGTSFFLPPGVLAGGRPLEHAAGDPLLWQHLFWFLGHPEVYVLILPVMGMMSDVIANNARKPLFGYRAMVLSVSAIGILGFLVWGHHMLVSGMNPWLGTAFMITTLIIAVPSAVKTFNWLATLWGGKIRYTPAMLFALGFISLFVAGGLTGIFLGSPPVNQYLHDTYFVVGHFHLVMASASLFGIFAAVYHWFPKMFGRMMNEKLGRLHFWVALPSTYGTFFPMYYAGIHGMMRRIFSTQAYPDLAALQPLNTFISISAPVMFAAHMIFVVNFFYSLLRGPKAEANPWKATTLEWTTSSPPPHHNWDGPVPTVHRWAYDYSLPGAEEDYIPQTVPAAATVGVRSNGHP